MRISDWSSDVCSSDLDILVDAAGAWADGVAVRAGVAPIGIQPYRRTMLQIATDPAPPPALPPVWGIDGSFYFKPEPGGRRWFSPHDRSEERRVGNEGVLTGTVGGSATLYKTKHN